jgi:hypothetical protein
VGANIVFADGTMGQTVTTQPASSPSNSQSVATPSFQAILNVTVGYSGSEIDLVYFDSGGGVILQLSNGADNSTISASGSFSFGNIADGNQGQIVVSQLLTFQLNLTSLPAGSAPAAASYSVGVDASDSINGANFQFVVAGLDSAGNKIAGTSGQIRIGTNSSSSEWSFQNSTGQSTFLITLSTLKFTADQNTSPTQSIAEGVVVFTYAPWFFLNATSQDYNRLNSTNGDLVLSPTPSVDQFGKSPNPLFGQSFLLTDASPKSNLLISINHELTQNSWSLSTQATWTGLRAPLESPHPNQLSNNARLGWSRSNDDRNSNFGVAHENEVSFGRNFGPMEIMVTNILRSLKNTNADERAQDISQIAGRELTGGEWISNPSFAWEHLEKADAQGDLDESLNHLLQGVAFNPAVAASADLPGLEQRKLAIKDRTASLRPTASRWGWRMLAECTATVLMAFYWPGVIRNGTSIPKRRNPGE